MNAIDLADFFQVKNFAPVMDLGTDEVVCCVFTNLGSYSGKGHATPICGYSCSVTISIFSI